VAKENEEKANAGIRRKRQRRIALVPNLKLKRLPLPVIARPAELLRRARPKQSPDIISAKIILEIVSGDCFVAPRIFLYCSSQ